MYHQLSRRIRLRGCGEPQRQDKDAGLLSASSFAGHTVRTQHGARRLTVLRRGNSELPTRPGLQEELGLRPQHHA
jgi:hypothetical protein